jgi:signal transduction histidine kinase
MTRALRREETTLTDARDYRGVPVFAATRYIAEADWGLAVKIDRDEALASVNALRLVLVPTFLAAVAVAIVLSLYLSARITRPLASLTHAAGRIQLGELDTRLALPADDEIGMLARTLEQMAARLIEANTGLERRVLLRTEELARTNAELEQFAYIASHDLQEPLRIVTSYLDLLRRRYRSRLDTDANEFIDYAVDAATRMRHLIDDLLAYSRAGRADIPNETADSREVVAEAIANLQPAMAEAGATVTLGTLPELACRPRQLAQVFQNLIGNALKYRGPAAPTVHVAALRRGGDWEFAVADNGIGIDPRYHERIFLIFQRLHGKEDFPGTGIGLALCKKIVESHGGRIWVESTPGTGATFRFTLPAYEGATIRAASGPSVDHHRNGVPA